MGSWATAWLSRVAYFPRHTRVNGYYASAHHKAATPLSRSRASCTRLPCTLPDINSNSEPLAALLPSQWRTSRCPANRLLLCCLPTAEEYAAAFLSCSFFKPNPFLPCSQTNPIRSPQVNKTPGPELRLRVDCKTPRLGLQILMPAWDATQRLKQKLPRAVQTEAAHLEQGMRPRSVPLKPLNPKPQPLALNLNPTWSATRRSGMQSTRPRHRRHPPAEA